MHCFYFVSLEDFASLQEIGQFGGVCAGRGDCVKLRPCVNFPAVGTLSWTSCHGPALGHDDLYFPIFIPFSFGADNLEIMGICLRATERHLGRASSSAPFPPSHAG